MPNSNRSWAFRWDRLRGEDGNILVLAACGMTFLCGLMALGLDAGHVMFMQRQLQTMADAAALAGALEIGTCGGTANCTAMQTAAKSALTENGVSGVTLVTQCGGSGGSGIVLMVNNGPCYAGASDPYSGNTDYVEAVMSQPVKTMFGAVIGKPSITVMARGEAGGTKPKYCIYVLSPSATDAEIFNGNGSLTANCGIIDDSNAGEAANFNGHVTVTTTATDIVGGDRNNGNTSLSPLPNTGVDSVPDPLSSLATPTIGACGTSTSSPYTGGNGVVINSNVTATLNPGVYCNGLTINGNATATFAAGTYIIKGNMIVNGNDTISGSGVTFYLTSGGSLTMNGNSHAALSAPTSGAYEGILYFQDRTDSSTVILNGDSTSSWQGVIYAPDANLTLNGGANVAAYSFLLSQTLTDNGNVNFTVNNDYTSLSHGSPIKQNLLTNLVE
jgi:Flp pilus assembly protein TadG